MKFFSFFSSRDSRRSDSVSTVKQIPGLRRKKSAPALPKPVSVEDFPDELRSDFTAQKSRRQSVRDFFQELGQPNPVPTQAFPDELQTDFAALKSRRQSVVSFFQDVGHGEASSKQRRQASRIARPTSSKGQSATTAVKPLDIDEDLIERIMGKPKEEKKASDHFIPQQKARASDRSRIAAAGRKPLSSDEIQHMFRGALQFKSVETKIGSRPRVVLVGEQLEVNAVPATDSEQLGHPSFQLCLPNVEVSTGSAMQTSADTSTDQEISSTLGAHGVDPGAVSYGQFLQLSSTKATTVSWDPAFFDKRSLLFTDPQQLGLRPSSPDVWIDRLSELGALHSAQHEGGHSINATDRDVISDMGDDLFINVVTRTRIDGNGAATLKTQIKALQRVLNTQDLWYDFSLANSRSRLGSLLWSTEEQSTRSSHQESEPSEQQVLLLQIMLASELLIRLDLVKSLATTYGANDPFSSDADRLEIDRESTEKIEWDLVLAERFLDNIDVSPEDTAGSMSFGGISSTSSPLPYASHLHPKKREQQIAGLLHFARALHWPNLHAVEAELSEGVRTPRGRAASAATSIYVTPLECPVSSYSTAGVGYFEYGPTTPKREHRRVQLSRTDTAQSTLSRSNIETASSMNTSGFWKSQTWLSGFILPGESASQYLMHCLVQHTPTAVLTLSAQLSAQSGFTYQRRSYWSNTSVVGRVFAAAKGASMCMGWISTAVVPESQYEGWNDCTAHDLPERPTIARIEQGEDIGSDSDILGSRYRISVNRKDFSNPSDGLPVMGNEVRFESAAFPSTQEGNSGTPVMCLVFASPINSKLAQLVVPLTYDVHFVSSSPCFPNAIPQKPAASLPMPNHQPRPKSQRPTSTVSNVSTSSHGDFFSSAPSLPNANGHTRRKSQRPISTISTISAVSYGELLPSDFEEFERDQQQQQALDQLQQYAEVEEPKDSARCSDPTTAYLEYEKTLLEAPPPPTHPLHTDYKFEVIPVATLLSTPPEERPSQLSVPDDGGQPPEQQSGFDKAAVVVLDCRGTEDLQLLARAWCAKIGEHAVVSKVGRTCLACSVREARALAIGVIIRI